MNISDLLNPAPIEDGNSNDGSTIPPKSSSYTEPPTDDVLTIRCRNQLLTPATHRHKIASSLWNTDCRLDTVYLRNEVCRRYESAGCPGNHRIHTLINGELRLIHPNSPDYSSMSRDIFNAIRR